MITQSLTATLRRLTGVAAALLLGGCTISTPHEDFSRQSSADRVVVSITHAMLVDDRELRQRFWDQVERVEASLQDRPGLLGFSKRVEILGDDAWTMTVWQDNESLQAFLTSDPHRSAMRDGMIGLRGARFARVELDRQDIPLSWDRALAYLETDGRGYAYAP